MIKQRFLENWWKIHYFRCNTIRSIRTVISLVHKLASKIQTFFYTLSLIHKMSFLRMEFHTLI